MSSLSWLEWGEYKGGGMEHRVEGVYKKGEYGKLYGFRGD